MVLTSRYILFWGDHHYPGGGWEDQHLSYDDKEAALLVAKTLDADWWHLVDLTTGQIVEQGK